MNLHTVCTVSLLLILHRVMWKNPGQPIPVLTAIIHTHTRQFRDATKPNRHVIPSAGGNQRTQRQELNPQPQCCSMVPTTNPPDVCN